MALTGTETTHTNFGPGHNGSRPASGSNAANTPAGNRRTGGFAELVRANAQNSAHPTSDRTAEEARTGTRPDLPTEVIKDIADEARAEAEAALAFALRSGQTLQTVIEATVQSKIGARAGGDTAGPGEAQGTGSGLGHKLPVRNDEQSDWRTPFG